MTGVPPGSGPGPAAGPARTPPETDGEHSREWLATLLNALEAARLDGPRNTATQDDGVAVAVAFDALLRHSRLSWPEVLPGHPMLAKICGHLGSAYPAEQEAAYLHAIRELGRKRLTWPAAVRLPQAWPASLPFSQPPPFRPSVPKSTTPMVPPVQAAGARSAPQPPDGDWVTTISGLLQRRAWRSPLERDLLSDLERQALLGRDIGATHAMIVRDIWWYAELAAGAGDPEG